MPDQSSALPVARGPRLVSLLIFGVCAAVLLTTLLQLALVDHFGVRYASDEAGLRLQQLSWQMRSLLDQVVSSTVREARVLAELPAIRTSQHRADARRALESLQRSFPDFAWIGVTDTQGKVLFMDLNGFKGVNDNYGHEEGDEVLRQFGMRLTQAVRTTDTVARLAGDEFVLLLEMFSDAGVLEKIAGKIMARLQPPYVLKTATVQLSASIGVAVHAPGPAIHIETLLARADAAMYEAKAKGKNCVVVARTPEVS